jgi:hypothetical protein
LTRRSSSGNVIQLSEEEEANEELADSFWVCPWLVLRTAGSVDKAFLGVWNLDLSKSKFPPGMAPKGSQIFVNENRYVVANQDPPPEIHTQTCVSVEHLTS